MQKYGDRIDAGRKLALALEAYAGRQDVCVLALPRGGVPVAFEVAAALHLPLDVFIVRKLGVPGHEEFAMGAIAMGGVQVLNEDVIKNHHIAQDAIEAVLATEIRELARREKVYRDSRPLPDLNNKVIILVDDGIATGATMRVAIKALCLYHPAAIIVAVPVVEATVAYALGKLADQIICPLLPEDLQAVGVYYDNFDQTSDTEVRDLLARAQSLKKSL